MAIINIKVQDRQTLLDVAVQYLGDATGAIELAVLNNLALTEALSPGQVIQVDTDYIINPKVVNYLKDKDVTPITD
ncbi:hypothetical protein [uncultured Microscilla sp.]|uniref:hypothetical protein n=1 Tax=uncultured Microscilla sp. TaxID=432653 RepID=UPI0026278E4C|nr:hypothetical protein [uncultured Microscilla sp.]